VRNRTLPSLERQNELELKRRSGLTAVSEPNRTGSARNTQAAPIQALRAQCRLLELKFTAGGPKGPPVLFWNDLERVLNMQNR